MYTIQIIRSVFFKKKFFFLCFITYSEFSFFFLQFFYWFYGIKLYSQFAVQVWGIQLLYYSRWILGRYHCDPSVFSYFHSNVDKYFSVLLKNRKRSSNSIVLRRCNYRKINSNSNSRESVKLKMTFVFFTLP